MMDVDWHLWLNVRTLKADRGLIRHNTGKYALARTSSNSRRKEYVVQKVKERERKKKRTSKNSVNLRN